MAYSGICTIEGCDKPSDLPQKGWCRMHYTRWRTHGSPHLGGQQPPKTHNFVFDVAVTFEGDDCLTWPFAKVGNGYARFSYQGKLLLVSRFLCELKHGAPPSSRHQAAHSCGKGQEGCVNPRHLRWASPKENIGDRVLHATYVNAPRGEKNFAARLTAVDVTKIRADIRTPSKIARDYGVSLNTILRVVRRESWKHIP
jgi:hypothetical protein